MFPNKELSCPNEECKKCCGKPKKPSQRQRGLASVDKVTQGPKGPRGFQGIDGTPGADGATGPQGFQGATGPPFSIDNVCDELTLQYPTGCLRCFVFGVISCGLNFDQYVGIIVNSTQIDFPEPFTRDELDEYLLEQYDLMRTSFNTYKAQLPNSLETLSIIIHPTLVIPPNNVCTSDVSVESLDIVVCGNSGMGLLDCVNFLPSIHQGTQNYVGGATGSNNVEDYLPVDANPTFGSQFVNIETQQTFIYDGFSWFEIFSSCSFIIESADSATGPASSSEEINCGDTLRFWSAGGIITNVQAGSALIEIEPNNLISASGPPQTIYPSGPTDPTRPVLYFDVEENQSYWWNHYAQEWSETIEGPIGPTGAIGPQGPIAEGIISTVKLAACGTTGVYIRPEEPNAWLAIGPTGTGFISATCPDGSTAGGDCRGINAVDWQIRRNYSNQVAGTINSVIGGGWNNEITAQAGGTGAGIFSGGGNIINSYRAANFIGGGYQNLLTGACLDSAIVGGFGNIISNPRTVSNINQQGTVSFIGGGQLNYINASWSFIGGGYRNNISITNPSNGMMFIGGGWANRIGGNSDCLASAIIAGRGNTITGSSRYSAIVTGNQNTIARGASGFIGGGGRNKISSTGNENFIGGGWDNHITASPGHNTICGGIRNRIYSAGVDNFIGGGETNRIYGSNSQRASIVGGGFNTITGTDSRYSVIAGGNNNTIRGPRSGSCFIGAGGSNTISAGNNNFIGAGGGNLITGVNVGDHNVIVGGNNNYILADAGTRRSVISGGWLNKIIAGGWENVIVGGQSNEMNYCNSYNFIGCGIRNYIGMNINSGTIVGGGDNGIYSGSNHTIAGGSQNKISTTANSSFIGGGQLNTITGGVASGTIGGGAQNKISDANNSFIGGGRRALITGARYSAIVAGYRNEIHDVVSPTRSSSFIGGGWFNKIYYSVYGSVVGGQNNELHNSTKSFIGGGQGNVITGSTNAVISGGQSNEIRNVYNSTIVGGNSNQISKSGSSGGNLQFIGGGNLNKITITSGFSNFIGAGSSNIITGSSERSSIVGGGNNALRGDGEYNFIGGGFGNLITGPSGHNLIGHGLNNTIENTKYASILGGRSNLIEESGKYNVIVGGNSNQIDEGNEGNFIGCGRGHLIKSAKYSNIVGGRDNEIRGDLLTITGAVPVGATGPIIIPGGGSADYCLVAGQGNTAIHDHAVVLGKDYQSHEDESLNMGGSFFLRDVPAIDDATGIENTTLSPTLIKSCMYYDAYSALSQSIPEDGTPITVDMNVVRSEAGGVWSNSSGEVTINSNEVMKFSFRVSVDVPSLDVRCVFRAYLERSTDGGSIFNEIPGSSAFGYCRTGADGENTGTTDLILSVNTGEIFRVRVERRDPVGQNPEWETIAGGSELVIHPVCGVRGPAGGPPGPQGPVGNQDFNYLMVNCDEGATAGTVFGTGFPDGAFWRILIPGGTVTPGQKIMVRVWFRRISGNNAAIFGLGGQNIFSPPGVENFVEMQAANGNSEALIMFEVVVVGNTSYRAWLDHTNSGDSGSNFNQNASSNVDFSQNWELSVFINGGNGTASVWQADNITIWTIDCGNYPGVTVTYP